MLKHEVSNLTIEQRDESLEAPISKSSEQSKICREFWCFVFGMILSFSAISALFNLQSSVNVEEGLGVTSLAFSYALSILFLLFVTPILLRKYGAKQCVIAADIAYAIYTAANFYPVYYTLLPGGAFMAFGEATIWPAFSMMNMYFASQYAAVSNNSHEFFTGLFSGYFFTCCQATQVIGNLISYAVLYGYDHILSNINHTANMIAVNQTCGESDDGCGDKIVDYRFCGVKDCQEASVIEDSLSQYKPVEKTALYTLIGIFLLLNLLAIAVHVAWLPNIGSYVQTVEKNMTETTDTAGVVKMDDNRHHDIKFEAIPTDDPTLSLEFVNQKKESSTASLLLSTVKSTFKQLIKKKQLLMAPICLYNGIAMGFVFSELNRAYASCVLGVQWTALCPGSQADSGRRLGTLIFSLRFFWWKLEI